MHVNSRAAWRNWLEKNHQQADGIWLVTHKKQVDGTWTIYDAVEDLIIPDDLQNGFDENPTAKAHFDAFSNSSKKGILWWIISAKRDATREKRVAETVALAEQNIKANHPRQ